MCGWNGRLLRVDLTNQSASIEDIPLQVARDFIGGRGLAIKYLHSEMDPQADPLSPENRLIFATGPLTATPASAPSRTIRCSGIGTFTITSLVKEGTS